LKKLCVWVVLARPVKVPLSNTIVGATAAAWALTKTCAAATRPRVMRVIAF
jgi:hypothetical protein